MGGVRAEIDAEIIDDDGKNASDIEKYKEFSHYEPETGENGDDDYNYVINTSTYAVELL